MLFWGLQIQLRFFCPDLEIFLLKDRLEEAVLTFKIMVKHPLVCLGIQGNSVDTSAFKSIFGELFLGRFENA